MRQSAILRFLMVVIGDGTIQVFDCMLNDLGTYRLGDVECDFSRKTEHRLQFTLQLPEVGTVRLLTNDDITAAHILRSGVVVSKTVSSTVPYTLLAVSVFVALAVLPCCWYEVFHASQQSPFSRTLMFQIIAYTGLLCGIIWLRFITGIKLRPLIRRILY